MSYFSNNAINMTSEISSTRHTLAALKEREVLANKRLADTQAEIAAMKTELATLMQHHYEHGVICERVARFARENKVSVDEMMARFACNRLVEMRKQLDTLYTKDMARAGAEAQ